MHAIKRASLLGWRPSSFLRRLNSNVPHGKVPPSHFQDVNQVPDTYAEIMKRNNQPDHVHPVLEAMGNRYPNSIISEKVRSLTKETPRQSMIQLFTNKNTRNATCQLLLTFGIIQAVLFYTSFKDMATEIEDNDAKLLSMWDLYERKDISQTIMAVHIGQLRQQLIQAGMKPVTSSQAIMVAQHLLSFDRNENGNLLIYVDPRSSIYELVPFSYEYEIQDIPKLNNVIQQTWDAFNESNSAVGEEKNTDNVTPVIKTTGNAVVLKPTKKDSKEIEKEQKKTKGDD
jgi:hypothetical protein